MANPCSSIKMTMPAVPAFSSRFFATSQERRLMLIMLAAMLYQAGLCLVNTLLFRINSSLVMLVELLIYLAIILCVAREIPRYIGLLLLLTALNACLLFLFRGSIDVKPVRDLLIILLFFWLGMQQGSPRLVDKLLTWVLWIVMLMGLFEWLAIDTYVKFFHTYSYFLNQSGLGSAGGAIYEGQALTLNGFRPDGIGRTILPWVFGAHRISSVMLEPVSLGNFAVITLIWAISRDRWRNKQTLFFLFAGVFLISLADSRFGLVMGLLILLVRALLPLRGYWLLSLAPWGMMMMLAIYNAFFFHGAYSDSFMGRLMHTGMVLRSLPVGDWLGLQSPLNDYGDMGYAYLLTRFGLGYVLLAWLMFWRIPLTSPQAIRSRGLLTLYITMILSISGSSLFALKTAGLLWFMLGSLCSGRLGEPVSRVTQQEASA